MKAVILCGGTGSRLKPLTEVRPKPLIKVLNVPVLESIIDRLVKSDIDDIYLSLGFMAQDIVRKCESLSVSANINYCEEAKPLGTAGGVKNCIGSTQDDIVIVSGDNIFDIDLRKACEFHKKNRSHFTVVGKSVDDPREYGCIVKNSENAIMSFIEKPNWESVESCLINTGIYIMSGELLSLIPDNTFFDFATDLFPLIFENKKNFLCFETDGFWGDMGEFDAYLSLSKQLLSDYSGEFPIKGTLILHDETDENGNSFIAPCLVGGKTELGCNNKIGPFAVLGDNVSIGSDCSFEGCIIGDRCSVSDRSDITGAIIDDNVKIGASCVAEKNSVLGYGATIGKFTRLMSGVKIWPGKTIRSESVVNKDMFYETPSSLEFDIFGISGKVYSQFTLSDAVKIGQAVASLKGIKRIGVSCDGKSTSSVYRELLCGSILACGVACYDFDESFTAQSYFYAAYCELDFLIYISTQDGIVNLSFFGKNGMPVSARMSGMINNNYRFSSFNFALPEHTGILYRMSLLSTAYSCGLQKNLQYYSDAFGVSVECENPLIKGITDKLFSEWSPEGKTHIVQFLINPSGTDMYCIEEERFFSSDKIRSVLSELDFADNKDVLVGEHASELIEKNAEKYGRKAYRVYEGANDEYSFDKKFIIDNLWNFDALFLCVRLFNLLSAAKTTLAELCSLQEDFSLRNKIIELDCAPSSIRNKITGVFNAVKEPGSVYFRIPVGKGEAKIRQMGNSSRVRMLVEAADMETAKEIMTEMSVKFVSADIDNRTQK